MMAVGDEREFNWVCWWMIRQKYSRTLNATFVETKLFENKPSSNLRMNDSQIRQGRLERLR